MTDPQVAVLMLFIFILTIMLGFPICFTLMAMAVFFGYYAYYDPERQNSIFDNPIFDLLTNQTYAVVSNDILIAVPLFLFMGYIIERANILDRLFHSIHVSTRRIPGSMAVAALATCVLFATATGIIGAVVTLMGLLALPAMLKARYDTSFSAGVICAGGCLGILIPPSIMLIVYAATTNVSIGRLYAGAMLPGLLLASLYIVYVVGRGDVETEPGAEAAPRGHRRRYRAGIRDHAGDVLPSAGHSDLFRAGRDPAGLGDARGSGFRRRVGRIGVGDLLSVGWNSRRIHRSRLDRETRVLI